ncbi:hypothetical protein AZI87_05965 [Bdellovibrio bacteriovorus]|uniref:Secreted protein n=1 Tax=Bdellovibrio bacteriovorus TaxID=959 RepID=A0A161PEI4_BDEBC|nr:hypothetical protein [Bdellovibrio bacteriovorus]KYG68774.1 hypothetical protein AZI87_05965 [Bdellovibrio bacteriovorus]
MKSVLIMAALLFTSLAQANSGVLGEYKGTLKGQLQYNPAKGSSTLRDIQCDSALNIELTEQGLSIPFSYYSCSDDIFNEFLAYVFDGNDIYVADRNGKADTAKGVVGTIEQDGTIRIAHPTQRQFRLETGYIKEPYCNLHMGVNKFTYTLHTTLTMVLKKTSTNSYYFERTQLAENIHTVYMGLPPRTERVACEKIRKSLSRENLVSTQLRAISGTLVK